MKRGEIVDPTAPLTPSGNLRRRQIFSRLTEFGAISAAALAVGVLAIVFFTIVTEGIQAISFDFLFTAEPTGVGPAFLGTIVIVAVATVIAAPIGIMIAIFLSEYAGSRAAGPIQTALDLTNGIPSIILALFVFGLIVEPLHTSSGFAGSVALAIIEVPLIARGSQEVLALVPNSMREASDALGVNRWRSVLTVVLPSAIGGIVTATILAVARAAGETAPLLLATPVFSMKEFSINPFEALPNVPVVIYTLSEEGSEASFRQIWGMSLVLVAFILFASLGARALLARSKRKLGA